MAVAHIAYCSAYHHARLDTRSIPLDSLYVVSFCAIEHTAIIGNLIKISSFCGMLSGKTPKGKSDGLFIARLTGSICQLVDGFGRQGNGQWLNHR